MKSTARAPLSLNAKAIKIAVDLAEWEARERAVEPDAGVEAPAPQMFRGEALHLREAARLVALLAETVAAGGVRGAWPGAGGGGGGRAGEGPQAGVMAAAQSLARARAAALDGVQRGRVVIGGRDVPLWPALGMACLGRSASEVLAAFGVPAKGERRSALREALAAALERVAAANGIASA